MKIEIIKNDTTLEVNLEGRLDTVTAPELEAALAGQTDAAEKLVLDLLKLEYVSSAGLRILLKLHKEFSAKQGMTVKNVNEIVREVFDITGFSDILNIG